MGPIESNTQDGSGTVYAVGPPAPPSSMDTGWSFLQAENSMKNAVMTRKIFFECMNDGSAASWVELLVLGRTAAQSIGRAMDPEQATNLRAPALCPPWRTSFAEYSITLLCASAPRRLVFRTHALKRYSPRAPAPRRSALSHFRVRAYSVRKVVLPWRRRGLRSPTPGPCVRRTRFRESPSSQPFQ